MASEKKRSVKGILKPSSSFDKDGHHDVPGNKQAKWDEMNILATFHPPGKDYGHIKIDEPPTPYSAMEDADMEEGISEEKAIDPHNLADRLSGFTEPKVMSTDDGDEEGSTDEDESPEGKAKRLSFENKRKMHYNEFQAVKLARQLLEDDDDEADDVDQKQVEENSSEENEGTNT